MKFKISKHKEVRNTNIFGKPVDVDVYYTIDNVILGIFHFSLEFSRSDNGIGIFPITKNTIYVRCKPSDYATHFTFKEDAEAVLNDMYKNPNKYIRTI